MALTYMEELSLFHGVFFRNYQLDSGNDEHGYKLVHIEWLAGKIVLICKLFLITINSIAIIEHNANASDIFDLQQI